MFAVIQNGSKQYRVSEGDIIEIEKIDKNVGDKIQLEVLLFSSEDKLQVGAPVVKGITCEAEVLAQGKGDKIVVYKYKAKKNVRKKQGHRQPFTQIKILAIK